VIVAPGIRSGRVSGGSASIALRSRFKDRTLLIFRITDSMAGRRRRDAGA
jgi:hypothetical protein